MLLTLPPPQSLDEPRIAPGGPPSLPLLELRRALQTHFGEPSQSSVRWHARFGAHEPVELDSERENAHRARAGCAPSIHGTWKNTTPTKSQRLRIMRLIRKLPCVTKCAGSCLHLALSQCCADTACIDSSRAKEEQMSRGGAARAAATAATCTAGARRASSLAQSTRGRSSPAGHRPCLAR